MRKQHEIPGDELGTSARAVVKLSPAEAAVVACLSRGLSNPEIAAELGKSVSTVKSQLASVYRKLGVNSRLRLLRMFRG